MTDLSVPRRNVAVTALLVLLPFDTVALLFAGIVHLVGARIPLGVGTFVEPPILPAGIVETLAGLLFAWATYAVLARRGSAWAAALTAHLFAIAGFLVGIVATLSGTTPFNNTYHRVMLAVFVAGMLLLLTTAARASLGRGSRSERAR
jgi:hypothetical protein